MPKNPKWHPVVVVDHGPEIAFPWNRRASPQPNAKHPPRTLSQWEYHKRRLQLLHAGFRYIESNPLPAGLDGIATLARLDWNQPGAYRLATPDEKAQLEIDECQADIAMSEGRIRECLAIIESHEQKLPELRSRLAELEAKRAQVASGVVELRASPEVRDLRGLRRRR